MTLTDMTERRRPKDARRESENPYRQLVELSPEGSAVVQAGRIVFVNAAMARLLGAKGADDVVGRPFAEGVHPRSLPVVTQQLTQTMGAGEPTPFVEATLLKVDGTPVDVELAAVRVRYQGQAAVYLVLRDLTERERAAQALRAAQAALARVARLTTLTEVAASVAHEVNQPLAAIVADADASLNWLEAGRPDLERVREALDAIVREGQRAGEVIQRICQLARKSTPRKHPMDVNDVVHDLVPLLHTELRRDQIALVLDLASGLGPVVGDEIQLQQVILNLVMNAIEAMVSVVDRPREVLIRSRPYEGDQVLVSVGDTGVGIVSDRADDLFGAFYTTKPGGMGMGLSISRSIIEAHGGRLWGTANTPYGATFHFTLPVRRATPH